MKKALSMRQELPSPKDFNHKQMMSNELLGGFDKELAAFVPEHMVLKASKSLFERLLEQMDSFSMYG